MRSGSENRQTIDSKRCTPDTATKSYIQVRAEVSLLHHPHVIDFIGMVLQPLCSDTRLAAGTPNMYLVSANVKTPMHYPHCVGNSTLFRRGHPACIQHHVYSRRLLYLSFSIVSVTIPYALHICIHCQKDTPHTVHMYIVLFRPFSGKKVTL